MMTFTNTHTYTRTRIGVIDDHFRLFLACSTLPRATADKLLKAVEDKELCAVGIYIEEGGCRIAEVSFEVDWDKHEQMIGLYGSCFDVDLPGWEQGVAPEAYITAQLLVKAARERGQTVRSWIRVSPDVRSDPARHKAVCAELGYEYGGQVPPWKDAPVTQSREVHYLPEATVVQREVR